MLTCDNLRHKSDVFCHKDANYWLQWNLENWARWMRSDEKPEGLPDRGCGGIVGYVSGGYDHGESYDTMDVGLAEATNAAIEGLVPAEQCAIYVAYRVMSVYRMRDYESALERAKAGVLKSLQMRGVWLG